MRAILFWALLLPLAGLAQPDTSGQKLGRPPFTLKIAPLELINPFQQAVLVQADLPIAPRWGVDLGIGWVVNSWSFAAYKGETYQGLKLRPALKYYFGRDKSGDDYVSLVFKYNDLYSDRYVNVFRQGRQYTEWVLRRRHLVTHGVGIRIGTQQYLDKHRRWLIEPFFGLGLRRLNIRNDALPPDVEFIEQQRDFNFERSPGIYTSPDIMMGFFVGITL